jgi:hypothetical protein
MALVTQQATQLQKFIRANDIISHPRLGTYKGMQTRTTTQGRNIVAYMFDIDSEGEHGIDSYAANIDSALNMLGADDINWLNRRFNLIAENGKISFIPMDEKVR